MYITDHWPIRYSSISSDGKFIAVAGRRGFAHYNTFSNRWKLFGNQQQEQSFLVRGGMVWYKNLLLVACETSGTTGGKNYEVRKVKGLFFSTMSTERSQMLRSASTIETITSTTPTSCTLKHCPTYLCISMCVATICLYIPQKMS